MAFFYSRAGLTLSHYDARAHLVVARRVIDNITPGWQQLGAVWLPLPHLLNLIPVQFDGWYRNGASAVAISVAAFGLACYAVARIVFAAGGSLIAAAAALSLVLLNPNLLYLQATPMTEALLLGLTLFAVSMVHEWAVRDGPAAIARLRPAGLALALACLTRYEAWPVTASAVALATLVRWHRAGSFRAAALDAARLGAYPVAAIALFILHSYFSTGSWFVTGGFFVADNPDLGRPLRSAASVGWGVLQLGGYLTLVLSAAGTSGVVTAAVIRPHRYLPLIVFLAPIFAAALPWYAFYEGHPFRIRYMVPLVGPMALGLGFAVGLLPRWRLSAAALVLVVVASENYPFNPRAPMVVESQLDSANAVGRRRVTAVLTSNRRPGEIVMASMGSLGHYMQELAKAGLHVCDFLHEGNGDIWKSALDDPSVWADWIMIEETAEGGDMLAGLARSRPAFLSGFDRVGEGGGVALYRRKASATASKSAG